MNELTANAFRWPRETSGGKQSSDHCAILLGLCNGAPNISEQLASFADQTHRNWSLVVSDDGSDDDGPALVRAFADAHPEHDVALVSGPRIGFAENFLSMIRTIGPDTPYAAFSDQDDRWLPGKLERGLRRLSAIEAERPAVYCGRTVICDALLRPLRRSRYFKLPPAFANALVQNIAGGNTMILNRAAIRLVRSVCSPQTRVPAHDWLIYQIVTAAGGLIVYDREPMVLYRQHPQNLIGANDSIQAQIARLYALLAGRFSHWNSQNIAALDPMIPKMTPEARAVFEGFKTARTGPLPARLRALRKSGIYRQTRQGTIALWLAAVVNRL